MGGRFGKYGDLKRKAALRKSRVEKNTLAKADGYPHLKKA
jgi:hypothetical protein